MNNSAPSQIWIERKAVIIGLLIIFFPLGLWGLWKSDLFQRTTKILVSALFVVLGAVALSTSNTEQKEESANPLDGPEFASEGKPQGNRDLGDLQKLERSSEEWSLLHKELVLAAQSPHPVGQALSIDGGWDWAYEQTKNLEAWLYQHPIAEVVLGVQFEKDTVCGDFQAVLNCKQDPVLAPLTKTALLFRLTSDDGVDATLNIPLAIAVNGTIVERWTGADCQELADQQVGVYPNTIPDMSGDDGSTMAERDEKMAEYTRELDSWTVRFNSFWNHVRQEAEFEEKK